MPRRSAITGSWTDQQGRRRNYVIEFPYSMQLSSPGSDVDFELWMDDGMGGRERVDFMVLRDSQGQPISSFLHESQLKLEVEAALNRSWR